jgi:DNA-binding transcriptional regulator YiaG
MPDPNTIEARLAALEAAVAAIQKQLGPPPHRTAADVIEAIPKITDVEALREAMRLSREYFAAQEPPDADQEPPKAEGEAA